MFAVVRERVPGPGLGAEQMAEFRRIRAEQPGYRGIVEVEADDGSVFILALWESEEQYRAGRPTIDAAGHRLGAGQWAGPPRRIGEGRVIYNDLAPD